MLFTLCCVFSSCPRGVRLRADRKLKTDELLRSLGGLFRVGNVRLGTLQANCYVQLVRVKTAAFVRHGLLLVSFGHAVLKSCNNGCASLNCLCCTTVCLVNPSHRFLLEQNLVAV